MSPEQKWRLKMGLIGALLASGVVYGAALLLAGLDRMLSQW